MVALVFICILRQPIGLNLHPSNKPFPMKKSVFILLALLFLNATRAADLASALVDVNKFWAYETEALSKVSAQACNNDPGQLIQLHLQLVQRELSSRDVSHLTTREQEKRQESLEHLKIYAERGIFPENLTHIVRRPVFIDHRGVHCAVGYLISASGNADLSRRISANMNTHYLKDMADGGLSAWVRQSGFTLNELAWIQPGYPFPVSWDALGGGTNGPVLSITSDGMGGIYATGVFDTAGSQNANNAAHYFSGFAGYDWMNLNGSGTNGSVHDIMVHNNNLYLAGAFNSIDTVITGSGVVRWKGSQWESLGQFYVGGLINYVNDLIIYRDTLYAGGFFRSEQASPQFFFGLAKWDGQAWVRAYSDTSQAGLIQGEVKSLAVHNGKLIVGGDFITSGTTQSRNIFALNGVTPEFYAEDIPMPVNDIEVYQGELYAATRYINTTTQDTAGLVRWRNDQWERVLDGFIYPSTSEVMVLKETPYGLVFGGDFNTLSFTDITKNLAALVTPAGQPEYIRGLGILDSTVTALEFTNDDLYLGGYFTLGYNNPMAQLGYASKIRLIDYLSVEEPSVERLKLYPNPSRNQVIIELPSQDKSVEAEMYDIAGKRVSCPVSFLINSTLRVQTGHLTEGTYLLKVKQGNTYFTERLIIAGS